MLFDRQVTDWISITSYVEDDPWIDWDLKHVLVARVKPLLPLINALALCRRYDLLLFELSKAFAFSLRKGLFAV